MLKYSLFRFFRAILTIWGVVTIVFLLPRTLADPVEVMAPVDATAEMLEYMRVAMGLDRPIWVQYYVFMGDLLNFDFGESYTYRIDAMVAVLRRFPATIQLAFGAMGWGVTMGIPLGLLAARRPGSVFDKATRVAAVIGQSVPAYMKAIVLLFLFTVVLNVFPPRGPDDGIGSLQELLLPSIALGLGMVGPLARLTRASMLDVLQSDYVTMARLKGLSELPVVGKHALRNAMIPVVTYMSLTFAGLLGGVVLVEVIFGWPGIGRTMIQAIHTFDFPVIQAVAILGAATYVFINYLVDIGYAFVDPRIRY